MAHSHLGAGTAPLVAKKPDEYYYGTRRFPDDALHLICCCALFSSYGPKLLARFFRGELNEESPGPLGNTNLNNGLPITRNPDRSNVRGSELRGCIFQMLDNNHPIYEYWSHQHPNASVAIVNQMVQPLKDAGESHMDVQRWNVVDGIAEPIWTRREQNNTMDKRYE